MWLFFGISAIIFTGFNLICPFKSKNEKWFRFGAISFTALTVCSFYSDGAMRVLNEDWGGLMDIMPTMSKALWVCVGMSILLNSCFALSREITAFQAGHRPSAVLVIAHIAEVFYHCHRIEGSDIAKGSLTHPRICSHCSPSIGAARSL